jgi:hypothetical protein
MESLLSSLPENIIKSLNKPILSYDEIIKFTIAIRSKFNTFKTIPNARMFWKLCAIRELHELMDEFPWIVWKHSFNTNFNKVRLEAIDVITLVIGALSVNNQDIFIHSKYDNMCKDIYSNTPFKCYDFDLTYFTEDIDKTINLINDAVRHIDVYTEQDQVRLCNLINKLCVIAKLDSIDLSTYLVAKLTLVFCRIEQESGTYHSDWHKISSHGLSECDMLELIIARYNSNAGYTLYDLAMMVEKESVDFRY